MSEERPVLVCMPWSAETLTEVRGNSTSKCDECGASVVVSAAGRQLIAEKDARIMCAGCIASDPLSDDTEGEVTDAIAKEVEDTIGIDPRKFSLGLSVREQARRIQRREERKHSN